MRYNSHLLVWTCCLVISSQVPLFNNNVNSLCSTTTLYTLLNVVTVTRRMINQYLLFGIYIYRY